MSENGDAAIKLFGKTIPLRPSSSGGHDEKVLPLATSSFRKLDRVPRLENATRFDYYDELENLSVLLVRRNDCSCSNFLLRSTLQGHQDGEGALKSRNQDHESSESREKNEPATSTSDLHTPPASADPEDVSTKNSIHKDEEEEEEDEESQRSTKSPEKTLPCPRCKSLDTKFCYYNNYSVNQPRYLCRNCQRYWTAGGTMRNVPVGAGRRKNKNSCHIRRIALSESAFLALQSDARYPQSTVLSFDSMASALVLPEKTVSCNRNGIHGEMAPPPSAMNSGDEKSSRPSDTLNAKGSQNYQGPTAPIPCFFGSPWPYTWNPALPSCASILPIPFYPAAAYWSGPWPSPAASNGRLPRSVSGTPTLGKHSRDDTCILIPKAPRIDDPEEAAKSSLWTMVGISDGELLKAFQPKREIKNQVPTLLHVNPAALSRSMNFQEAS
ncbi:hypothetical protein BHM03_00046288 [Ensete ventricosum]|nr:hypothetical protein BHM03_00046288 [Ensete ventricosum]